MPLPAADLHPSFSGLALAVIVLAGTAAANGVPTVDGKAAIQHGLEVSQMTALSEARQLETAKKSKIDDLHKEQLAALDQTLALLSGSAMPVADLESLPGPRRPLSIRWMTATPMRPGFSAMRNRASRR
ncbi:hypothetical protein ACTTAI_00535 (plasmid) [Rhodobacter capsulatus]|uniref:hypothetical protein n=1 Tax=Rhodobacter capsulatus TaxID=1061 RepID=UPI00402838FD